MSICTPVIDKMLVCKPAQYSQSVCGNCAQRIYSCEATFFIVQGIYHLQYKHPHAAIQVTLVQGHSKVFTTGQARVNPENYVIKCVGGW